MYFIIETNMNQNLVIQTLKMSCWTSSYQGYAFFLAYLTFWFMIHVVAYCSFVLVLNDLIHLFLSKCSYDQFKSCAVLGWTRDLYINESLIKCVLCEYKFFILAIIPIVSITWNFSNKYYCRVHIQWNRRVLRLPHHLPFFVGRCQAGFLTR